MHRPLHGAGRLATVSAEGEAVISWLQSTSVGTGEIVPDTTSPVDPQLRMAREDVEVRVAMQDRRPGAYGDRGNETVDQLANGFPLPPAAAVEHGGIVVVGRPRWDHCCPRQQALEAPQVGLVTRTGEDFHPHGIADGDLLRQHLVDEVTGPGPGVAQEFYPG